jgi:ADP-heptose:LPS heptosyltransferase
MTKSDPWDVYVNLNDAYETNVTCHYVDSMMRRAFGDSAVGCDNSLQVVPTADEIEAVEEAIQDIGGDYIVLHMRRWAWENKNVSIDIWAAFITMLETKYPDLKIVTVGADYDYTLPATKPSWINLNKQLSIGEIQHLISCAKMFVGMDSGPYHIACATATPIILLSSHLAPEQIMPWRDGEFGKDVEVVKSDVPCLGCYARQQPPVRNLTCENTEQWACANKFSAVDMFEAAVRIMQK